jgi:hypothetical protein
MIKTAIIQEVAAGKKINVIATPAIINPAAISYYYEAFYEGVAVNMHGVTVLVNETFDIFEKKFNELFSNNLHGRRITWVIGNNESKTRAVNAWFRFTSMACETATNQRYVPEESYDRPALAIIRDMPTAIMCMTDGVQFLTIKDHYYHAAY